MARSPDADDELRSAPNRRSESELALPRAKSTARHGPFSGEQIWSGVKTFAWLFPLTLLIWVYAEQQQEYRGPVNGIPVSLQSSVPNRSTEFADGAQQVAVNLTLQGPRDAVDKVGKLLLAAPGLQLDVGSRGLGALNVPVASMAQSLPLFAKYGVTVIESQPPDLRVNVDNVLERDATVLPSPQTAPFSGTVTFDKAQVKLRGPRAVMDNIALQGGLPVVYADLSKVDVQKPGDHPLETVPLVVPIGLSAIPAQVQAKVQITTAYTNGVIDRVLIHVDAPLSIQKDFVVQIIGNEDDPSIGLVNVTGPADKVALVVGQSPRVQATAVLTINQAGDVGQDRQGTYTIANLPEGVKPTAADAARKVTFRLIPRPASGG